MERRKNVVRFSLSKLMACAGSLVLLWIVVGCTTSPPREYRADTPVRITEIHYNPSRSQGRTEFIEVTNTSGAPVDLSGWTITGAGPLTLPKGTTLGPGESLVVCRDLEAFDRQWGMRVKPVGVFQGKLRNSGETVRVVDPEGRVADEAAYSDNGEGAKADGTGLSLHRIRFRGGPDCWKAGEPTPGEYRQPAG